MPDNSRKFSTEFRIELPEWINESYFEPILRQKVEHFVRILHFATIPAMPAKENYSSLMVRVLMDIELDDGYIQQRSYVLKTLVERDRLSASSAGGGNQLMNSINLFPKEKLMYEHTVPMFERLYEERAQHKLKFAPQPHWIDIENGRITLVLEDLNVKKYRNINRLQGFDFTHMRRVLQKLAEFHAASVIWQEQSGTLPTEFQRSYLPANFCKSKSYHARIASYKAAMASWGLDNYEKYTAALPTAEQFLNSLMDCLSTDANAFKVLNHGDFWSNNIMLNYTSSGTINQVRFVDFQLSKWNSPAQDLWQLIICSAHAKIRIKEFDNFIRIYHGHLVKSLALLDYNKPVPTLKDLHISMLKYGFWGFFNTFNHLVFVLLPPSNEQSLPKLLELNEAGESFRQKAFTNPLYVRAALDIMPFLYNRGILKFEQN